MATTGFRLRCTAEQTKSARVTSTATYTAGGIYREGRVIGIAPNDVTSGDVGVLVYQADRVIATCVAVPSGGWAVGQELFFDEANAELSHLVTAGPQVAVVVEAVIATLEEVMVEFDNNLALGWADSGIVHAAHLVALIADINSGDAVVVAPVTGYKLKVRGYSMRAIGGAATASTAIVLEDTSSTVEVVSAPVALLAENLVVSDQVYEATALPGAGLNGYLTDSNGVEVVKTGSALTTATSIDVTVLYERDSI